jgi:hypothetical protein
MSNQAPLIFTRLGMPFDSRSGGTFCFSEDTLLGAKRCHATLRRALRSSTVRAVHHSDVSIPNRRRATVISGPFMEAPRTSGAPSSSASVSCAASGLIPTERCRFSSGNDVELIDLQRSRSFQASALPGPRVSPQLSFRRHYLAQEHPRHPVPRSRKR